MEKIKEPDKRTAICIAMAGMALVLLFCALIRMDKEKIREADVSDLTEETDVTCVIESVTPGEYIRIDGYAYVEGESIHTADQQVLLYDAKEERYLQLPTQMNRKEALDQTDDAKKNYSGGGFFAKAKASRLGAADYEICLAYRSNGHRVLVHTGIKLNG